MLGATLFACGVKGLRDTYKINQLKNATKHSVETAKNYYYEFTHIFVKNIVCEEKKFFFHFTLFFLQYNYVEQKKRFICF